MVKRIKTGLAFRYRALHWKLYNAIYRFFLCRMKLTYKLPSGIPIVVSSFADWAIYNDVFVAGEYDIPIRRALSSGSKTVRILDLGANVGLFLKRTLHLRRTEYPSVSVEVVCVEGAPSTYAQLQQQMPELQTRESARLIHGLAGRKSGDAILAASPFHAMSSLARHPKSRGVSVQFVDLCRATEDWPRIELLKCDIEGAEQMVLENYQDLLRKVDLAVFEFHLDRVDRPKCVALATDAGLTAREVYHENDNVSVEALSRQEMSVW